ncbi:MAG: MotA/TolQ/ExbB proton channel family protein [Gammaproteobacteria bacterium]|nr:MotA/TolQ/ExbB proton channel family protein [Gammaproteobacteria bacterium]
METYSVIVKFFQSGGVFMYPLMLVFAIGVAITIERFLFLSKVRRENVSLWKEVEPLVSSKRFREAFSLTSQNVYGIGQMLSYGLARAHNNRRVQEIEAAMEEGLMESLPKLEKRTHYLSTFANVATLMGLLGTIIGLIQAFTAVSNADPAEKADLLSSSISVAMNTTAFGLMVAIPLLLIYTYLQTKTNEIVDGQEMVGVKFLNIISSQNGHE